MVPLLADMVTADTGISFGLLLGLFGSVGAGVVVGIVSRVLHGAAIKTLQENQREFTACVQELKQDHKRETAVLVLRVQELETDKKIRDALAEDRSSEVTPRPMDMSHRSGVRPRTRKADG